MRVLDVHASVVPRLSGGGVMNRIRMVPDCAPTLERAAREKAWLDFLTEVRASLLVWEIDPTVRAECEPVTAWLARCANDLGRWTP